MAEIRDYSNNPNPQTADRWPEGMAMSAVNDTGRVDEGIIGRWEKDINGSLVTAGTSTAYTLTPNRDLVTGQATPLYDGLVLGFKPHVASGASPTLDVQSTGAKAIVDGNGQAIGSGYLAQDNPVKVIYSTAIDSYIVVSYTTQVTPSNRTTARAAAFQATLAQGLWRDLSDPDYTGADDNATWANVHAAASAGDVIYIPPRATPWQLENAQFNGNLTYIGFCTPGGTSNPDDWGSVLQLKTGAAAGSHILVSDRWNQSNVNLGRPVNIFGIAFDGNKANNASGGNAIMLCNYRPNVDLCLFRNMVGDCIHMPDTLKDTTPFTQQAVNPRVTRCHFDDTCDGRSIYAGPDGQTTYSDGWMLDCIDRTKQSVLIHPSSGWVIDGNHWSANGKGLRFSGSRALKITNNYHEGISEAEPLITATRVDSKGFLVADNQGSLGSASTFLDVTGSAIDNERCVVNVHNNQFPNVTVPRAIELRLSTATNNSIYIFLSQNDFSWSERYIRKNGSNGAQQFIRDAGDNSWNYRDSPPTSVSGGFIYEGTRYRNMDFTANPNIHSWVNTAQGNPGTIEAVPCFRDVEYFSDTLDPPSIPSGSQWRLEMTALGVGTGRAVIVFPPIGLQSLSYSAYCTTDTINIVLTNSTGAAVDLPSATWEAMTFRL